MNKLQYIKLLELRGITKLEKGETIFAAIERSGGIEGIGILKEMIKVNDILEEEEND